MTNASKYAYITLVTTFLIFITATIFVWQITKRVVEARVREIFSEQSTTVESWVTNRLEHYKTVIYSLQGFWIGNENVTPEEWYAYVQSLKISDRFSGLTGVSYAKRIDNQYVTLYIYPLARSKAIGFDLASEERRLVTLNKAIDENTVGITDRISLAADQISGFAMYAPHYASPDVSGNLEERRSAVEGITGISFKSESVFKDLSGYNDPFPSLDFELYKGTVPEDDHLLYDHDAAYYIRKGEDRRALEAKRTIIIGGETFTLLFASKPSFHLSKAERSLPNIVLVSGIIVSIAIFAFYHRLIHEQEKKNEGLRKKQGSTVGTPS